MTSNAAEVTCTSLLSRVRAESSHSVILEHRHEILQHGILLDIQWIPDTKIWKLFNNMKQLYADTSICSSKL